MRSASVYRVAILLAAGGVICTVVGFLIAPWVVERRLETSETLPNENQVAIERVSINPFSGQIVLTQTVLTSADGRYVATLPRIEARLDARSLFRGSPELIEATLESPEILIPMDGAGVASSSIIDGLEFLAEGIRALVPRRVERLVIRSGRLRLGDPASAAEAAPLGRAATATEFDLELFGVDMPGVGERLPARFTLEAGLAGTGRIDGEGRFDLTEQSIRLEGDFQLRDIEIAAAPTEGSTFSAPRVLAEGVAIDGPTDAFSVATLTLDRPELRLTRRGSDRAVLPGWVAGIISGSSMAVSLIEISDGSARVLDQSVTPEVSAPISSIDGIILPHTGELDGVDRLPTAFRLEGRLPGSGPDRIEAFWGESGPAMLGAFELDLTDIDLAVLSPYFRSLTGRGLESGRLDLEARIGRRESGPGSEASLSIQGMTLGGCSTSFSPERWPLERALALLEDDAGRVELQLNALPDGSNSGWLGGLDQALRERLTELSDRPFEAMAELVGRPGQGLNQLPFQPGSAEITGSARSRLEAIARALAVRPALGLQIEPSYNPSSDRRALAAQQMRLHIALATSAGPAGRMGAASLDFDSDRVRSVLDEFGAERLSPKALASVLRRFPEAGRAYYQALFNRLVDNEAVPTAALERLADFRTRSVVGELRSAGVADARVLMLERIKTIDGAAGAVLLPLELSMPETQLRDCRAHSKPEAESALENPGSAQ